MQVTLDGIINLDDMQKSEEDETVVSIKDTIHNCLREINYTKVSSGKYKLVASIINLEKRKGEFFKDYPNQVIFMANSIDEVDLTENELNSFIKVIQTFNFQMPSH